MNGGMPMANYHLSIKIFSRGKGEASVVQKAAYRAAELLRSEYEDESYDYTRKQGIVHKEILLPENAPAAYTDRAVLWNAVEKSEKRKDAQLAREIEISLPVELTQEQNIVLARKFAQEIFVNAGMCADVCVHDTGEGNPHAHIMLTLRPIEPYGKWGQKSRQEGKRKVPTVDWNDRNKAEEWRRAWAAYQNTALRINGHAAVVDHRSYERQGSDIVPTVHLGPAAARMEKRGIRTERGDKNREIEITNKEIRQLRARMNKLSDWLKEEAENPTPPTLYDVFVEILNRPGRSKITNIQNAAEILAFLQRNDIADDADMDRKVNAMHGRLNATSKELNDVGRRIKMLNEHIYQSEFYNEHRPLKRQYDRLYAKYEEAKKDTGLFKERKIKKALEAVNDFREANHTGLTLYNAAEKHLREHMGKHYNPKKPLPISDWKKELKEKLAKKATLTHEYDTLKEETYKIEQIRASVKTILHNEEPQPERAVKKSRGVEI